jgi:hypothetical protein
MKKQKGYIAILSFLVIGVVVLGIALSVSLTGVEEAKSSLNALRGQRTTSLLEGCFEETLYRLRNNNALASQTLTFEKGSCTLIVTGTGANKTINLEATLTSKPVHIKRMTATVKVSTSHVTVLSRSFLN